MALICQLIYYLKIDLEPFRIRNALVQKVAQECDLRKEELEKIKGAFENAKLFNGQLRDGLLINLVSVKNEHLEEAIDELESDIIHANERTGRSHGGKAHLATEKKGKLSDAITSCKECGMKFRFHQWHCDVGGQDYGPTFMRHCIEECEAYKKLDLIRECHHCKEKLLSPV